MNKAVPQFVWVLIALMLLIGVARIIVTRDNRSADRKILDQKLNK